METLKPTLPTTHDVLAALRDHAETLRGFGVAQLGLFGSYRRGTPTPASDLDFLVVLQANTFNAYMDTKFFLEDLFGRDVDLVLESDIKPSLRDCVLKDTLYVL